MSNIEQLFIDTDTALQQRDLPRAKDFLQKVIGLAPGNLQANLMLGQIFLQLQELSELSQLLDKCLPIHPHTPDLWFYHGKLMALLGNNELSVKSFVRARDEIKGKTPLIIMIANELLSLGQAQIVWDIIPPAESTDRYHIRLVRAKALAALGAVQDARQHLVSASQQLNLSIGDRFYIWQAAKSLHYADIELDFFQQFLAMKQSSNEDKLFLSDIYINNRMLPQATATIAKLLAGAQFTDSNEQLKSLVMAARCANLSGDKIQARTYSSQALSIAPESTEALEIFVDYADAIQIGQLAQQYIYSQGVDKTNEKLHQLAAIEQKQRQLTYAKLLEKNENHSLAFDYYQRANAVEKKRVQADHSSAFNRELANSTIDKIIADFPKSPDQPGIATNEACPIFILGMPRSGTTLLERVLGGLTGVKTTGENKTLGQLVSQDEWDRKHYKTAPPMAKSSNEWQKLRSQYLSLSNNKDSRFFTEKMPHNFLSLGYMLGLLPDAPIIHLRRDPRDVCWSIYTHFFSSGHSYSVDLSWALEEYERSERLMDHFKAIAPDKILTLDYESFVHHPEQEGKRIAQFCGLPWHASCLDFHKQTGTSYTASELQVRQKLNTKGIGRWRHYEGQLSAFLTQVEQSSVAKYRFMG